MPLLFLLCFHRHGCAAIDPVLARRSARPNRSGEVGGQHPDCKDDNDANQSDWNPTRQSDQRESYGVRRSRATLAVVSSCGQFVHKRGQRPIWEALLQLVAVPSVYGRRPDVSPPIPARCFPSDQGPPPSRDQFTIGNTGNAPPSLMMLIIPI